MRYEDYQLIPLHYRWLRLLETNDIDVLLYTFQRLSQLNYSTLKNLEILVKKSANETVVVGDTKVILTLCDSFQTVQFEPLSFENIEPGKSMLRFTTSVFFMKAY